MRQNLAEFAIYLWGTPKVADPEERAAALAAAGFTVVDWEAEGLAALSPHGLKGMVHHPTAAVARRLASHPDLWGYHCGDEPYPEAQFAPLAEQFRQLREADPGHPAFLNMLSTAGPFLRRYMRATRPDILSYDYYQWWWGSDRYFEKLEQFREAAVLAGVPLGSCLEANADPYDGHGTPPPDNAVKLRQSVYTNLAYGVTLIGWFSSNLVFQGQSGELTPSGRDVAALNAELRRLGPFLAPLQSVDVFHTGPLPKGTREAPTEYWVHLRGDGAGLVQGMFEDADGVDYLLVANRDYRASQSVAVRLQSKWLGIAPWHEPRQYSYAVQRLDRRTGAWVEVKSSSFVGFTCVVAAGDGELFRIETRVE
ncbi:MAG: hypothetical protein ABIL09_08825 [Gemmatimonadota bacterium]